jgi:hypothetical protein
VLLRDLKAVASYATGSASYATSYSMQSSNIIAIYNITIGKNF